jgi:hypothetical protein
MRKQSEVVALRRHLSHGEDGGIRGDPMAIALTGFDVVAGFGGDGKTWALAGLGSASNLCGTDFPYVLYGEP